MNMIARLALALLTTAALAGGPALAMSQPHLGPTGANGPSRGEPSGGRHGTVTCPQGEQYSPVYKQCVPTVASHH
jgi:hypothetical protein